MVVFTGYGDMTIRLIGVDTPESRTGPKAQRDANRWGVPVEEVIAAGGQATAFTASICPPGITVTIPDTDRKRDQYGRLLAYVVLPDGTCLNEVLIRMGYGFVYRQEEFGQKAGYVEAQRHARQQKRKFWATIWRNVK